MDEMVQTLLMTTNSREPSTRLLRVLLIAAAVSTTVHYTHNFVFADDYPPVSPLFPSSTAYRVGIAVFYPLLTALAVRGYVLYAGGQTRTALPFLAAYSMLGFTSIFHFVGGVPSIPPFFMATIFTDFVTGAAIMWFVVVADRQQRKSHRQVRVRT